MSKYVVDASVGIKWFVPEIHADAARRLQSPLHDLHCPGFFEVEFTNILWKKRRRAELTREEADAILAQVPVLPLHRHSESALLSSAFDLAEKFNRSVYDCLYLGLALREGCQLVTADDKFVNSMMGTGHATSICHVQAVP